jgi:hypothetical protein
MADHAERLHNDRAPPAPSSMGAIVEIDLRNAPRSGLVVLTGPTGRYEVVTDRKGWGRIRDVAGGIYRVQTFRHGRSPSSTTAAIPGGRLVRLSIA